MGLCGKSCRARLGKSSDAYPTVETALAMAVVAGRRKRPGQTRDLAVAFKGADARLPAREFLSTCCAAAGKNLTSSCKCTVSIANMLHVRELYLTNSSKKKKKQEQM